MAARADGLPPPVDDGMGGPHEGVTLSVAAKAAQHPGQGAASGDAASGGSTARTRRVRAAGIFESPATTVSAPGNVAARSMGASSVPNRPLAISMSRSVRSGNW